MPSGIVPCVCGGTATEDGPMVTIDDVRAFAITLPPPDQFAAFVAKEQELWSKVIKNNSLKPH